MSDEPIIPADQPAPAPQPAPESWLSQLPENMRADPTLQRFSSVESLAGSYLSARQLVGADTVKMPKEEGDWSALYDKLGRPESFDKYDIDFGGDAEAATAAKPLLEAMHSLGLNQRQASGLVEALSAIGAQTDEQEAQSAKQARMDQEAQLEALWGRNMDRNTAIARRALKELADDATLDMLDETQLGNDPRMLQLFFKIGAGMMEDGKLAGVGDNAITVPQAQAKINELMAHPDYLNPKSQNRQNIIRQLNDMYEVIHGVEPANKNLLASV